MKKIVFLFSLILVGCSNNGKSGEKYGEIISLTNKSSIQSILEQPEENKGKEFLISGEMTNVCQKKGCWMTIKDLDNTEIFVRFKDYGFFMPKDGFGRKVLAQGIYSNSIETQTNDAGEEIEVLSHLFTASGVILD